MQCLVFSYKYPLSQSSATEINLSGTMERYLNILEAPREEQEKKFDGEKIEFINSKISIWDYFGIPQATYMSYTNKEKSKMFKKYYAKLTNFMVEINFLFLFYGLSGKISGMWSVRDSCE